MRRTSPFNIELKGLLRSETGYSIKQYPIIALSDPEGIGQKLSLVVI